jgi:hypothetical protein
MSDSQQIYSIIIQQLQYLKIHKEVSEIYIFWLQTSFYILIQNPMLVAVFSTGIRNLEGSMI